MTYVCDVSVNAPDADNVAIRRENGELADQDVARLALRIWNFSFHIHGLAEANNRHLEGVYVVSQRARSPVAYGLPDYIIRCNIIEILEGAIDHHQVSIPILQIHGGWGIIEKRRELCLCSFGRCLRPAGLFFAFLNVDYIGIDAADAYNAVDGILYREFLISHHSFCAVRPDGQRLGGDCFPGIEDLFVLLESLFE